MEKKSVVDKLRLTYEGIFSLEELYKLIDTFLREKGYDKRERIAQEKITPEGKFIHLDIEPWKKYTDYVKSEIRLKVYITDMKDVEIERDGVTMKMNQGKIQMVFDGYLSTDYENRGESKPIFFFIRTIFDKYIYRIYTDKYEGHGVEDINQLHAMIKSFLNLYRFGAEQQTAPEAEMQATY